ncbi:MAG: hypothetical protein RLZZ292_757 [Bacteroidota bacterium]|jgi:hypothetical protein
MKKSLFTLSLISFFFLSCESIVGFTDPIQYKNKIQAVTEKGALLKVSGLVLFHPPSTPCGTVFTEVVSDSNGVFSLNFTEPSHYEDAQCQIEFLPKKNDQYLEYDTKIDLRQALFSSTFAYAKRNYTKLTIFNDSAAVKTIDFFTNIGASYTNNERNNAKIDLKIGEPNIIFIPGLRDTCTEIINYSLNDNNGVNLWQYGLYYANSTKLKANDCISGKGKDTIEYILSVK